MKEQVEIGEALICKLSVDDILEGRYTIPYLQPKTWLSLQKKDPVLSKLSKLIHSGQKPEEKRTGLDKQSRANLQDRQTLVDEPGLLA